MTVQGSDDGSTNLHRSYAQAICKRLAPLAVSKDLGRTKAATVQCIKYLVVPVRNLRSKFEATGFLKGCPRDEIIDKVGPP